MITSFIQRIRARIVLLAMATLLAACSVSVFTLLAVNTPDYPLAGNEVAFVEFEFLVEEGDVPHQSTVVVFQAPENWLVLYLFLGEVNGVFGRFPLIPPAMAGELNFDDLPAPEEGMQRVVRLVPQYFVASENLPDRGFLAFVADGESTEVGNIKAAFAKISGSGFEVLYPTGLQNNSFAEIDGATDVTAQPLQYSGEIEDTPAVTLQVAESQSDRIYANAQGLEIKPAPDQTTGRNQYAYRFFLAMADEVADIADAPAQRLPVTNGIAGFETVPGGQNVARLFLNSSQMTQNTLYYYDLPVYANHDNPGQESLLLELNGQGSELYHYAAIALVSSDSAAETYDISAGDWVSALRPGHEVIFRVDPGDTGFDLDAEPGVLVVSTPDGLRGARIASNLEARIVLNTNSDFTFFYSGHGGTKQVSPTSLSTGARGQTTVVDVTLTKNQYFFPDSSATARIEGRVMRDGEPLAGVPVWPISSDLDDRGENNVSGNTYNNLASRVWTNADGYYSSPVRPGSNYQVRFGGTLTLQGAPSFSEDLPFFMYYNGPDGVTGVDSNNGNSDGNLATQQANNGAAEGMADLISIGDSETLQIPDVNLPAVRRISGQVVDADNTPIANLQVTARADGTVTHFVNTRTDSSGDYELWLIDGRDYRLWAGPCAYDESFNCIQRYVQTYYGGDENGLAVGEFDDGPVSQSRATLLSAGNSVENLNIRIPESFSISGVLTVDGNAPGVEGNYQAVARSDRLDRGVTVEVDEDTGAFEIGGLTAADDYYVYFWYWPDPTRGEFRGYYSADEAAGTRNQDAATRIDLSADVSGITIDLIGPASISGIIEGVIQNNGQAVAGVPVYAESRDLTNRGTTSFSSTDYFSTRNVGGVVMTDSDGRYSLAVLPGANYRVFVGGATSNGDLSEALPLTVYYNGANDIDGVTTSNSNNAGNYSRFYSENSVSDEFADLISVTDGQTVTLDTINVPRAYKISGEFVDADGTPIPRLNFVISSEGLGWGYRSQADGRFSVYAFENIDYTIQVGGCAYDDNNNCLENYPRVTYAGPADGLSSGVYDNSGQGYENGTVITLTSDVAHINVQVPESRTVSGTVLVDGQAPGSGSTYRVNAYSEDIGFGAGADVDPDTGEYQLKGLISGQTYHIYIFRHDGDDTQFLVYYSDANVAGVRRWNDKTNVTVSTNVTGIDFDLRGPASVGTIEGTISFPADTISSLDVSVQSDSTGGTGKNYPIAAGQTSVTYRISDLIPASDYRLSVYPRGDFQAAHYAGSADGNDSAITRDWQAHTALNVTAGQTLTDVDMNIPRGETLKGTVNIQGDTDCDAAPGCEVRVNAYSSSASVGFGATITIQTVGGVGSKEFELGGIEAANDYRVSAEAMDTKLIRRYYAGTPDGSANDQSYDYQQATLLDPSNTELQTNGIGMTLTTGSQLTGTVTLDTAAANDEFINVNVYSQENRANFSGFVRIAAGQSSGEYSVAALPAADYRMFVSAGSLSVTSPSSLPTSLDLTADRVLDLSLAAGYAIKGTVRDDGGNPIAGVHVVADQSPYVVGTQSRSAMTANDGSYTIRGLKPGQNYRLISYPRGYQQTQMNDRNNDGTPDAVPDPIVLAADFTGAEFTSASFVLTTGASIAGEVRDAGGNLLAGAYVHASASLSYSGTNTGANGSFEIKGLDADTDYNLWVSHPRLGSFNAGTVSARDTDIALAYTTGFRLAGQVSQFGGATVSTGYVTVYRDTNGNSTLDIGNDNFIGNYAIAADGSFDVPLLAEGTYFVRPRISGYFMDLDNTSEIGGSNSKRVVITGADIDDADLYMTEIDDDINSVVGVIDVSGIANIDSIEVVAINAGDIVKSIVVTSGEEFAIDKLLPGQYSLYVYAYNAEGIIVASGTAMNVTAAERPLYNSEANAASGNAGLIELTE